MSPSDLVLFSVDSHVALITVNDPEAAAGRGGSGRG